VQSKWECKKLIIPHIKVQYILSANIPTLQTVDLNRQKREEKFIKNVTIHRLQILPLQFLLILLVLPLQMYISFIYLSFFPSRACLIGQKTLITDSIEPPNVPFPFIRECQQCLKVRFAYCVCQHLQRGS